MGIHVCNAVFALMGGRVLCSGCMVAQSLEDSEKIFPPSNRCKRDDQ